MFSLNDKVIVSDIFPDVKLRGQRGLIALRMWEIFDNLDGAWDYCYEVEFEGGFVYVNESELRRA